MSHEFCMAKSYWPLRLTVAIVAEATGSARRWRWFDRRAAAAQTATYQRRRRPHSSQLLSTGCSAWGESTGHSSLSRECFVLIHPAEHVRHLLHSRPSGAVPRVAAPAPCVCFARPVNLSDLRNASAELSWLCQFVSPASALATYSSPRVIVCLQRGFCVIDRWI